MTSPDATGAARTVPVGEQVAEFESIGVTAFTTTRAHGDFSLAEPSMLEANTARWNDLQRALTPGHKGLVSALQVHGVTIAEHAEAFEGWTRIEGVDAHVVRAPAMAAAVTIADCVPAFVAHPSGVVAMVHAGWRGTAARLLERVIARFVSAGMPVADLHVHLGPAVCGRCYEVGPDVYEQLTGWQTIRHRNVDLRALLAEQAKGGGVTHLSVSAYCTRCDNDRFYSHRAGDLGRQVSVIASRAED